MLRRGLILSELLFSFLRLKRQVIENIEVTWICTLSAGNFLNKGHAQ